MKIKLIIYNYFSEFIENYKPKKKQDLTTGPILNHELEVTIVDSRRGRVQVHLLLMCHCGPHKKC